MKGILKLKAKCIKEVSIFLIIFSIFIFSNRDFFTSDMLAYVDVAPFPVDATQAFNAFISSWKPIAQGGYSPGLFKNFVEFVLISLACGNSKLAQTIYLLLPYLIAFIAMYLFLSHYIKSVSAIFIVSFIYSANPYTITISAKEVIYAYAFMPLIFLFILKFFERNRIHEILMFTIFLTIAYYFSEYILLLILPIIIILLIRFSVKKGIRSATKVLLYLSVSAFFFLTLILPFFSTLTLARPSLKLRTDSLVNDVTYTYSYGNSCSPIIQILTVEPWGFFWSYPSAMLSGIFLPIFAFGSFLIKKKGYIVGFAILSLITITFIWFTHLRITIWVFKKFPILSVFRNPNKLSLFLMFTYSPLIATSLACLFKNIELRRITGIADRTLIRTVCSLIICIILILSIVIYTNPLFSSGDMGVSKWYGINYTIPITYKEIATYLNAQNMDFARTLWLPYTYENQEIKLKWLDTRIFNYPLSWWENTLDNGFVSFILQSIVENSTTNFGALISIANIKYVVVDLSAKYKGAPLIIGGHYIIGSPEYFIKFLNNQKDLELVVKDHRYVIYRNKKFVPIRFGHRLILITARHPYQIMKRLIDIPGFEIDHNIFALCSDVSSKEGFLLDHSDILIIDDLLTPDYANKVRQGQEVIIMLSQINNLSNVQLFIPKSGYYKFAILSKPTLSVSEESSDSNFHLGVSVSINNLVDVDLHPTEHTNWYESKPIYIGVGQITLNICSPENVNIQDFLLFEAGLDNRSFNDLFTSAFVDSKLSVRKISDTRYMIKVEASRPFYLVFPEPYHLRWSGHANGVELTHFCCFGFLNGFYVSGSGNLDLEIIFEEQELRDKLLILWSFSWFILLATTFFTKLRENKMVSLQKVSRHLCQMHMQLVSHLKKLS